MRTFVDTVERDEKWLSARQDAVLADGRSVVLLDGRGWGGGGGWAYMTAEQIERTARSVVGPDEAEMEASHWEHLALLLGQTGNNISAAELRALPHDVELSSRVRASLCNPTGMNM